jgi:hypothetical protein
MPIKQPNISELPQSELFYPVNAESIPANGRNVHLSASPEQMKKIAERLDVQGIKDLQADLKLETQNGGHILFISGNFKAKVTQESVVTMKLVDDEVADNIEAWFADHDKALPFIRVKHQVKSVEDGDEAQMLEEKDDPEPLTNGQVDLGEVVIQFLSLAINRFPRENNNYENIEADVKGPKEATLRPNPFAALKNWRPKD